MDIYPIDETSFLFSGAKILMDISFRNLNFAHVMVPKESFDAGLAQTALYRSNMVSKGFEAAVVDPHVDAIIAAPKMEMFLDPFGVVKVGNIEGHDVDHLLGSTAGVASASVIQELCTYAAIGTGIMANLPGAIWSEADCKTLLDKTIELIEKWGPRHLKYMDDLDNLEFSEIPLTKQRPDLLRLEASTNDTRFYRYLSGWDHDDVFTKIIMTENTSFKFAADLDVLDNQTQDIAYGTGTNYQYENHAIAATDPRPSWRENLYDTYAEHIEKLLVAFNPAVYGALDAATVKSTLLATQTTSRKGLLHLGDFYLVGRPAGLSGIAYRTDIFTLSAGVDAGEDIVLSDSRSEWHFTVDPEFYSLALDLVSQEMSAGEAKDAVIAQKSQMDAKTEDIKCTLLASPKYLSQNFGDGGAYAGLVDSGGADLGTFNVVPGTKYSEIVGDKYVDGYITYDPAGILSPRVFTDHIDLAKAKPWKYFIMPSSNTTVDGAWSTTVYKLFSIPLAAGTALDQAVMDLDADQVQGLVAAGVLVGPYSDYSFTFDNVEADKGAVGITGLAGMTMEVLAAGVSDGDGVGIAYADKHVYDKDNLTDDGFICSEQMNSLQENKVDIAYHGCDQTPFIQIAIRALAVAPAKDLLIPAAT